MAMYNTIVFYNYTDKNFSFSFENETYIVKAGERESFPEFLAVHGAKHLVDRELIRTGRVKELNNEATREEFYSKILGKPVTFKKEIKPDVSDVEDKIEVEEEFPDLKKLEPVETKPTVDLSRSELFAKVKALGIKIKVPITNEELRRLIANNDG